MMQELFNTLPQTGTLLWIGIRPARGADLIEKKSVQLIKGMGLEGDHYSSKSSDNRQVTLIQHEHILSIASYMGYDVIHPNLLRRNLVIKSINLLALKDKYFTIGEVVLEMTNQCHPCSRMEKNLGVGGYNAVRGHGGITARIIEGGEIRLGDQVKMIF
jgi:MOSC domain-containing protein YiiM